ncbi:MAG: type II secretion system F family protein [Vulcanimicrobiota bacterium]
MLFSYKCTDGDGNFFDGVVNEDSLEAARAMLESKGWQVLRLQPRGKRGERPPRREPAPIQAAAPKGRSRRSQVVGVEENSLRLSLDQCRLFTVQLSVLLGAGVPLARALESLCRAEMNALREAAEVLYERVTAGHMLSQAMRRLPRAFDRPYVAMIEAGEKSGQLQSCLTALAHRLETRQALVGRIRQALAYPAAVTLTSLLMLGFLLYYMFPRFVEVFAQSGLDLPLLTRVVMALSSNVLVPLVTLVVLIETVVILLSDSTGGRLSGLRSWLLYQTPVLGALNRKASLAQTCQDLGGLVEAGVPLSNALDFVARQPRSDLALSAALSRVQEGVVGGDSLASSFGQEPVFPLLLTSSVAVAEESGELPMWLDRVRRNLALEVDLGVAFLMELVEPLTLGLLGIGVAIIVLAAFLPIYQMVTVNLG